MQQSNQPRFHDHTEDIREFAREWHKADIEAKQTVWQNMYNWLALNYSALSLLVVQLTAIFYVLVLLITH